MDALKTIKTGIHAGDQTYLNHRTGAITYGIDAFVKSLAQRHVSSNWLGWARVLPVVYCSARVEHFQFQVK